LAGKVTANGPAAVELVTPIVPVATREKVIDGRSNDEETVTADVGALLRVKVVPEMDTTFVPAGMPLPETASPVSRDAAVVEDTEYVGYRVSENAVAPELAERIVKSSCPVAVRALLKVRVTVPKAAAKEAVTVVPGGMPTGPMA